MNWYIPVILVSLLAISGCASVDMVKQTVIAKAVKVSDKALNDAIWWTCKGASIGSVQRKYGMTADRADMYKEFCVGQGNANIVGP